jgi:hypothetical protein
MSVVSSIIGVSPKERYEMATYYVKTMVTFTGYVEADSEAEAEEKGWYYDNLEYDGVYDVEVEEQESDEDDE